MCIRDSSIALSGDGARVAVAAEAADDVNLYNGKVSVYEWNATVWSKLGEDVEGEGMLHYAGKGLSLSQDGSRMAVGMPGADKDSSITDIGLVRVYD